MPTTDDLPLAADFAPASYDDWRKLVDGVLKGAPFEKLVSKTYDGIKIQPIYPRAHDATPIAARPAGAPWQIMQRIDHPDAKKSNTQALHDLENGATGLTLVFEGANGARGFGLVASAETIATLFDGIFLDAGIGIELHAGPQSRMAVTHLADYIKAKAIDPAACVIRFGLDPIGATAVWGSSAYNWWEIAPTFTDTIKKLATQGFKGPFAVADGRIVHDAGGSEVQELSYVLAVMVAYLRALEDHNVPLETARSMVYARLSADADQFLTMAKFRALRLLWARIEDSCGLTPKPLFVAADTAWRMLTQRDPAVNMLRSTMASFAAGLGGANALCVLPHTLALGLPDSGARRIARNTQLVLLEESNLAKVSDPAAGAGGIETLTRELCDAAWAQFQEIEKAGGAFPALGNNVIQPKIAATRKARQASVAKRREVLTGASEFPNLHEARAAVLKLKPAPAKPYGRDKIKFNALEPIRLATPFEALRDKSDHLLARRGARPKVFLANLGTPADFTARAGFARSLFETGGIEAVDFLPSPLPPAKQSFASGERSTAQRAGEGLSSAIVVPNPSPAPTPSAPDRPLPPGEVQQEDFTGASSPLPVGERSTAQRAGEGLSSAIVVPNPSSAPTPAAPDRPLPPGEVQQDFSALAAAFKASGAALVCLCSSDKLYATSAVAAAQALQAAGAKHIYLAGKPGDLEAPLRDAGVRDFMVAGGDALAMLVAAYALLDSA